MNATHLLHTCSRLMVAALAMAGLVSTAQAEPTAPSPGTVWNCWMAGSATVECRLADAQALATPVAVESHPSAATADPAPEALSVAPSGMPSRRPLPALVDTILERPAALRDRRIRIPLYSPPESRENAEELADAVMCGARKHCQVRFIHAIELAALYYEEDPARD